MNNDPITLEIIQNALTATADEMFAAMGKTAMSSIIYEVLDMGSGITDAEGRIASSGAGIPAFIGVLDKSVQFILSKHEQIHPGDVFITNDPWHGGVTHLNDIVLAMPVFQGDTLIAWTAIIAHNSDIGGMAPGSLSGDATEIFHEGLRLPAVKIINEGVTDQAVMDIITCNSRMPDFLKGDVWAAIAGVRVGSRRLEGIAKKYGSHTFLQAMDSFMDFGEKAARAELAKLPKGTFELDEKQDDGQVFNVKVTISNDEFVVDFRDNPDHQTAGPGNATRDGTVICAQMIFKALTGPDTPANDGSFRPLKVLTREGSIFHAKEPAAVGFYYETEIRSNDLIWRCLAPHIPHVLPAGHFSSICGTFIGGTHPDTGRQYTIIEPQLGGWGAGQDHDGNSCMFCNFHGETYNTPAEVSEARNGLYVDRMALNDSPGGEGEFTGGRGLILEYRIRTEQGFLTMGFTRFAEKPWGMDGGHEGSGNYVEVIKPEGTTTYNFVSGLPLTTDDVVRVVTSSGAGFGDPKKRNRASVAADIKAGLITTDRAASIYGADT